MHTTHTRFYAGARGGGPKVSFNFPSPSDLEAQWVGLVQGEEHRALRLHPHSSTRRCNPGLGSWSKRLPVAPYGGLVYMHQASTNHQPEILLEDKNEPLSSLYVLANAIAPAASTILNMPHLTAALEVSKEPAPSFSKPRTTNGALALVVPSSNCILLRPACTHSLLSKTLDH